MIKYEELLLDYCYNEKCEKIQNDNKVKRISNQKEKRSEYVRKKLIKDWNINAHNYLDYLVEQTKNGNIVWKESKNERIFTVVLDGSRCIRVQNNADRGNGKCLLIRQIKNKKTKLLYQRRNLKKITLQ